jgi:hypothetical protein
MKSVLKSKKLLNFAKRTKLKLVTPPPIPSGIIMHTPARKIGQT